jgi:hypothetical protein
MKASKNNGITVSKIFEIDPSTRLYRTVSIDL